jgi:hypothetical protein
MHDVKTCARRVTPPKPRGLEACVDIIRGQEVGSMHDAVASLVHYNYAPFYILEPSTAETLP